MKKILSIDGGGIRGIIPATVLADLEDRTGRSIADLFDIIAGTSTGGILALGLTKPAPGDKSRFSAQELVELYEDKGSTIFHRDLWHRALALGNLLEEKFSSEGIEGVLRTYFEEARISEARTEILITSYDIEQRRPYFFKRHKAREDAVQDFLMWQVARATSAAPTYFEPARLDVSGGAGYMALVDGGVYANNPAMCGYVEARRLWPDEHDFLVVSLGTGELTRPIRHEDAKGWGLARWAQPILGVVFDGVSDTVDYQLQDLCRTKDGGPPQYFRYQVVLTKGSDDLDDSSRGNIHVLKLLAQDLITQESESVEVVAELLTS